MQDKIENIQALRGVAALGVFVAHLAGAERDYGGADLILPHWFQMGVTGVDLFFLISGYVMMHVAAGMTRSPQAASRFLFNRAARIYPLYWVVTIALLILYAGKKAFFGEDTLITNLLTSFLLAPDADLPIINVGWTLIHEMYFYIIFSGFLLFAARYLPILLLGWASIIVAAVISGLWMQNPWTEIAFSPLTFEFILGCIIAMIVKRGEFRLPLTALVCGALALIVMALGFFDTLYPDAINGFGQRALVFGPPYALILYGAVTLEAQGRLSAPKWLIKTGDASYSLYLVHVPVFLAVGKSLSLVGGESIWFNMVLIATYAVAALTAAFAAHHFIEKPSLRFTKKLGGRIFKAPTQTKISPERAW